MLEDNTFAKDVISDTPVNTVSCGTYNKVESDIDDEEGECINTSLAYFGEDDDISIYEDPTKACVIGLNEA